MEENLLTLKEVAKILDVNPITVRRMIWRRELPFTVVGQRLYKFKESDIKKYIDKNTLGVVNNDNEQQTTQ